MRISKTASWIPGLLGFFFTPLIACAETAREAETIHHTEVSGLALWILANISYAGMRAQDHPSMFWRVVSFIFGFPGTLLTWIVVREGQERAYGIDLPTHPRRPSPEE